jgi:hypothetical protein
MSVVSQWCTGGLRTRKAEVAGSIPSGGSSVIQVDTSKFTYSELGPRFRKSLITIPRSLGEIWQNTEYL